jgi:hypothetical protein
LALTDLALTALALTALALTALALTAFALTAFELTAFELTALELTDFSPSTGVLAMLAFLVVFKALINDFFSMDILGSSIFCFLASRLTAYPNAGGVPKDPEDGSRRSTQWNQALTGLPPQEPPRCGLKNACWLKINPLGVKF